MKIILASTSPRRKEILEKIGLKFITKESGFEEKTNLKNPEAVAKYFAESKAKTIIEKFPNDLVIAADTIVVLQNAILGKPKNNLEARQMLLKLSDKTHLVITGLTVARNKKMITKIAKTKVKFKKLDLHEITAYVKTKDPLDKAGAYGIQGKASIFVEEIEGDYFNIMGLPVSLLNNMLLEFKINVFKFWK